jgi:hypothetical protein
MPTRTAHARWEGRVKTGKGEIDFGNGLFRSDYSFGSRCETDVTLTSTLGQPISLSHYRGRSNLVLVFAGEEIAVLTSRVWLRSRPTIPGCGRAYAGAGHYAV